MREIKFRSWDKLAKKMSNSYNLQRQPTFNSEHNGKFCISTISPSGWLGFDGFSENERQIAMQYTGLKDKNDIEVYHKDIGKDKFGKKVIVEWCEEHLCYGLLTIDETVKDEWNFCLKDLNEVIGNIYENKELLN